MYAPSFARCAVSTGTQRRARRNRLHRRRLLLELMEDRRLLSASPIHNEWDSLQNLRDIDIDRSSYASDHLLVRFQDDARVVTTGERISSNANLWKVPIARRYSVSDALSQYRGRGDVVYAQPDYVVRATANHPTDRLYAVDQVMWGLYNTGAYNNGTPGVDIDAAEAWDVTQGSDSVVVAVIDSGINYNHADLQGNIWSNTDEIPGNGVDDDGNGYVDDARGWDFHNNDNDPMDDNGHGTHVAGTVGALANNDDPQQPTTGRGTVGVAWDVSLMPLKFLDANGSGYTSNAIAAVEYATRNGAHVSNNSWGGGGYSQAMFDAIADAGASGHVFVAAAGNDGRNTDTSPSYPAGYNLENVISVAATDNQDQLASFSNYGATSVDLGAPGVDIWSTYPQSLDTLDGTQEGSTRLSGTSMATPHVAGTVALVRALHSDWTAGEVVDQVLATVDPTLALDGRSASGGRLNAARAVGAYAPLVVGHTPRGTRISPVGSVELTFSEAVTGADTLDVVSFTGPDGTDLRSQITGVSTSGRIVTVTFTAQTAYGSYSLRLGPEIYDQDAQAMDQDRDGNAGEPGDDSYTATFTIGNEFESTDVPAPIYRGTATESYLTIDEDVSIADLNVRLDVSHSDLSDLDVYLYHPDGTRTALYWGGTTSGTLTNRTFDDEGSQPQQPLSVFDDKSTEGQWKLRVEDWQWSWWPIQSGTLNSWSLIVTPSAPPNAAPDAVDDAAVTVEDQDVTVSVLSNDSDPDGDTLFVTGVGQPARGTATLNDNDTITYTPEPDVSGSDTFTYTVSDGNGGTDTATVSITIDPVDDPPAAADDSASTDEDVAVSIDVLANDVELDGDALAVAVKDVPAHGTAVVGGDKTVTYAPDADYFGPDSFTYTIDDGTSTDTATVSISVRPVNDAPVAENDAASTDEDIPVTLDLFANDTDVDGDELHVTSISAPSHGSVVETGGSVTYTPDADYYGSDSFTYTVSDGNGGSDTATVDVTISSVNDDPSAVNDSATTSEDTSVTVSVLENDTDVDGDSLLIDSATDGANGTVTTNADQTLTYTPDPGFVGTDSFDYTVSDGHGGFATATVDVTVNEQNDPPNLVDDTADTDEDVATTISVLANDTDPDGDPLTIQGVTQGDIGTVTNNGDGTVTYTPDPDANGSDTFTYTVADGKGGSATANVVVTIAPVNDAPTASDATASTDEDTPVDVTLAASDIDGDSLSYTVESPSHGTLSGTAPNLTYTPDPDFNGSDGFSFTVNDGLGGSDTAVVSITVAAINDAPVANDGSVTTDEDTAVPVTLVGSDVDGDSLIYSVVSGPAHGTLSGSAPNLTYSPGADFNGADELTFKVSDGTADSALATIAITVKAVNDAPVAGDDAYEADQDTTLDIAAPGVLANDQDVDGDALTATLVTEASGGTVALDADGSFTYTPHAGFSGPDSFTYTVSDSAGGSDTATVTITVSPAVELPLLLAADDFESGNFSGGDEQWASGGWSASGDTAIVSGGVSPGSYQAQLRNANAELVRTVDTSGFSAVDLTFTSRLYSLENGDTAVVQVSGDGTTWQTVHQFVNGDDDNQYHQYTIGIGDVGAITGTGDQLYVRFDARMSQTRWWWWYNNDYWFIDNVQVSATALAGQAAASLPAADSPESAASSPRLVDRSSSGAERSVLSRPAASLPSITAGAPTAQRQPADNAIDALLEDAGTSDETKRSAEPWQSRVDDLFGHGLLEDDLM